VPDDVQKDWPRIMPVPRTLSSCDRCARRTTGVCALIRSENLDKFVTRRGYQRRTMIRMVGEPLRHAMVIRSGVVSVARSISGGRRQVIDFLMAADTFGFSNEGSLNLTVSVLEDTEVCRIPIELLRDIHRSPNFLRGLIRLVEAATVRVRNHVVLLGKLKAEERLAAFLLRYRATSQRIQPMQARLDLPMTRRDIADHLGMAPETVCRTLSWLQDEQMIVQIPDGVRILDVDGLHKLAGQAFSPERAAFAGEADISATLADIVPA
jgi:CRP/FNR family transcriptional regulator